MSDDPALVARVILDGSRASAAGTAAIAGKPGAGARAGHREDGQG
jgi:hypothetical protein